MNSTGSPLWLTYALACVAIGSFALNLWQWWTKRRWAVKVKMGIEYGKYPNDNARRLGIHLLNTGPELQKISVILHWRWRDGDKGRPFQFSFVASDLDAAKTFKERSPCSFYLVNKDPQEMIYPMQPEACEIKLVISSGHVPIKVLPIAKWHKQWKEWAPPREDLPDSPLSCLQQTGEPEEWFNASPKLGPDVIRDIRPDARHKPKRGRYDALYREFIEDPNGTETDYPVRQEIRPLIDDFKVSDAGPS